MTQLELYSSVAPPLLDAFLGGYNATVIAYGQTGSGKTYTMGSEAGGLVEDISGNLSDNVGLIPRFMSDLFASLVQRREASEKALLRNWVGDNAPKQSVSLIDFRVSASFLEVYGEDIYDLLDDDRNALKIREGSNKEVCVKGLKSVPINNSSEAMDALNTGTLNRTTASTLMNFTSSRSHACFAVNLHQTTRSADGDELITTSRFTFVDLAGSERMKKTGAEGDRAKEGIKINEGLLALGNVINALADEERLARGGRVHVVSRSYNMWFHSTSNSTYNSLVHTTYSRQPYRQSKLTRLLQDALGGNSQTLFLACVSPSDTNASETLSTLHYANRARNIKNSPTRGVDAASDELRRLRTLTNLLKSELIKHRFTAAEPEVERSIENSDHPQDIGVVNEGLLQRDDVISYMKIIDEMASQLSGSNSLSSSDQTMQQSLLGTPPRRQLISEESSTFERSDLDVEGNDNSDGSDIDVNTDEDMGIADELLLETQHEDQISKIEGDIEEQEERLLQLKERFVQYHDIKEKYEMLSNEVQKLEAEKQELIEKLEKAQSGEGSSWIKSKLEQVKASLVRARLDVRKQQQKCRDTELDAQRCKGLERRIEEMKNIKANLIKKQQDDAKRQKDFSKTKAREIQDARKRENIARKTVLKLEAENTRLKTNLENSQLRNNNLSKKLKETESNLKQTLSTRRKNTASSHKETITFAPSNARTDSIKHVLDKTVSDRVALTQNQVVYKSKVALRESLFHSMTTEVKMLNELKRECEAMENERSNERLADIKDREDNVQDLLIQMELVEKNIEELQAKYPRIEDETTDNTFDEHEPALKMISKLNSPDLRALLLLFLSSSYSSEVCFCHSIFTQTAPFPQLMLSMSA